MIQNEHDDKINDSRSNGDVLLAGSIVVTMDVIGPAASVDAVIRRIWQDIQSGVWLNYNGQAYKIDPTSVRVNNRPYEDVRVPAWFCFSAIFGVKMYM